MGKPIMNDAIFTTIKTLIDSGRTIPEISKLLQVSETTIARCRRVDSFEGYKELIAKRTDNSPEESNEDRFAEIIARLDVQIQLMQKLNTNLYDIVKELMPK